MNKKTGNNDLLTFGGHLEVLRWILFRIILVTVGTAIVVFSFKDITWQLLLAPSKWNFCTYRWIEQLFKLCGVQDFHFDKFNVDLIATDLSSQFMTHLTTSIYLGLIVASPYILYELFHFVSPALYKKERMSAIKILITVYLLFMIGALTSYFLLFPISFRFLGTYSVEERIRSMITLDSYISTFMTLTLLMGVVFQLPIIAYILGKLGIINASMLARYRKHAFIIILTIAAIITPGQDILTLSIVTLPLYLLYEISIRVVKKCRPSKNSKVSI